MRLWDKVNQDRFDKDLFRNDEGDIVSISKDIRIIATSIYLIIHTTKMEIYTVEHWQENWEELMERVEKGEHIGVTNGENTAIMIPADDELIRMYRDHEEGS